MANRLSVFICVLLALVLLASPVAAFGAGNIASISKIEGRNWRHGDLEDLLTTVAFLRGQKWTSMMVKRAYFGNWLRDYSQAIDVGTLKGVQADTLRVLVWVLAFMSFGYATAEFEVTSERLGVYRPEEHIDNPKDYADNVDARQYDKRLRGPVERIELEIDAETGMKNYIANERGGWATSLSYVKFSFARSIHYGRLYTHGSNKGREEDLCEALRCLGQGLHCLEDFGAHTNYTELALREMGHLNVFPHVGTQTLINLHGKQVFPLVTGTFGGVDFLHSVLGEATDHVTQSEVDQSEVDQLNSALTSASAQNANPGSGKRGFDEASGASNHVSGLTEMLSKIPGTGGLIQEAVDLQADSDTQAYNNAHTRGAEQAPPPYSDPYANERIGNQQTPAGQTPAGNSAPAGLNVNIDPQAVVKKIYPILAFRDKVVRSISKFVGKIPGLEKGIDTISEKVTLFVMGLLAPYVKPLIATASNALKQGSGTVVSSSAKQQYLVWDDPRSSDPTHSMLSKDHFSNILNEPAGQVAAVILQYVAPRVIYAWDHPEVPEEEVFRDISRVFHHPATRDSRNVEIHKEMFEIVEIWARKQDPRTLNDLLSAESVRQGRNHRVQDMAQSLQPLQQNVQGWMGNNGMHGTASHSTTSDGPFAMMSKLNLGGGQTASSVMHAAQGFGLREAEASTGNDLAYGSYHGANQGPSGYTGEASYQQQGYEAQNFNDTGGHQSYGGGTSRDYTQHNDRYERY